MQVVVRMQPDPVTALDEWVGKQSDEPTRAEAIRRAFNYTSQRTHEKLVVKLDVAAIDLRLGQAKSGETICPIRSSESRG